MGCRILSINCNGFKSFVPLLNNVLSTCDILCVQELMLLKQECHILNNVHDDFYGYGISPVDCTKGVLSGRPYGGVGFLWRKSLDLSISVVETKHDWLGCIKITDCNKVFFLINVYMPYESDVNLDKYQDCLGKLSVFMQETASTCISVVGDFNADISKTSVFGDILYKYCNEHSLHIVDKTSLPTSTYTYVSAAWGTTSWLDHVICTEDAMECVSDIKVVYDCICSDHHPVSFIIDTNIIPVTCSNNNEIKRHINWDKLLVKDLNEYRYSTGQAFDNIPIPDGIKCIDPNCANESHANDVNDFYCNIIRILSECGSHLVKNVNVKSSPSQYNVAGWADHVDSFHNAARDAYLLWQQDGKPTRGYVYDLMRSSKRKFKYALRKCKNNNNRIISDRLADKLCTKSDKDFWKDIRNISNSKVNLPNLVGDAKGDQIPNMWNTHYKSIFNSVSNSKCSMLCDEFKSSETIFTKDMIISASEVHDVINSLSCGKSPGLDRISSEHLKFAGYKLSILVALFVSSVFIHGFLPQSLLVSVIVPILKDKNKRIGDKNNYRPICLSNIFCKIIELLIFNRMEPYLVTCANQFGFKRKHGTDMCVFTLKEIIRYYINHGSLMYVTFLDASQAFDRVNHTVLLRKLFSAGVPMYLLRLIAFWYCNQFYHVRWGNALSVGFTVSNGVRQGGVLSPLLFNFYMNELSVTLNSAPIGCCFADVVINHLMYADDLVVFAPSAKGLQTLLDLCVKFGEDNDILFNRSKSKLMLFDTIKCGNHANILVNGNALDYVSNFKYLGHIIDNKLNDELDMKSKERMMYGRSNMLIRKFYFCSASVKHKLFSAYCSNIYLFTLWAQYRRAAGRSIKVAYNNAFRIIMGFNMRCSASGMFAVSGVLNFSAMYRRHVFSFKCRLESSFNSIIMCLIGSDVYSSSKLKCLWHKELYSQRSLLIPL